MKYIVCIILGIACFGLSYNLLHEYNEKPTTSTILKAELKAEILEDDQFQIFYSTQDNPNYNEVNSNRINVLGKKGIQALAFKIPIDKEIKRVRLDIGQNINQLPITIESFSLVFGSNKLTYKEDFLNFFKSNKYIEIQEKKFKTSSLSNRYDPYFESEDLLETIYNLRKEKAFSEFQIFLMSLIVGLICSSLLFYSNIVLDSNKLSINIFIAIFFYILILPTLSKNLNLGGSNINLEKRELVSKPDFNLSKEYSSLYQDYFNDNFGLRNHLVNFSSLIKIRLLKVSPKPDIVQFGKSNFLFFNKFSDPIFSSYSNSNLLTDEDLKKKFTEIYKRKRDLSDKGIKYIIGFWPNKHTIYNDYLPFSMEIQRKSDKSLADQYYEIFTENNFLFVDVRKALIAEKYKNELYYKLDTHWNSDGAFLAYQEFFKQTFSELSVIPFSKDSFNISYKEKAHGDLTNMLGIEKFEGVKDQSPSYKLKNQKIAFTYLDVKGFPKSTIVTRNIKSNNNKKVLIFRDSFSTDLVQFFSLHFYEVTYMWQAFDYNLVNKINPDIVISCPVERYLYKL